MNSEIAKKFGRIKGKISCLDSHLTASKNTVKHLKKTSLEHISEKWFDESIEKNDEIYNLVEELWNMIMEESYK